MENSAITVVYGEKYVDIDVYEVLYYRYSGLTNEWPIVKGQNVEEVGEWRGWCMWKGA